MTLEKLKKMLKDGAISQTEYDELVSKLGLEDNKKDDKKDDSKGDGKDDKKDEIPPNLQALIQSAVDRATNKIGNDNKKLREQLEALKREKMSSEEIKQLEIEEKEKALLEKEKEIKDKEMRMYAIKAIKDAGLDDGSDTALSLVDILIGADEDTIKSKTATFKTLVDKAVSSQVQQRFKESGRDPKRGGSADDNDEGDKNDKTSVAVELGKKAAERDKTTNSVLENYIGGTK